MDQERWTEVDRYITERVLPADPALEAALAASDAAGLPAIQVSNDIHQRGLHVRLVPEADLSIGHAKASNSTLT